MLQYSSKQNWLDFNSPFLSSLCWIAHYQSNVSRRWWRAKGEFDGRRVKWPLLPLYNTGAAKTFHIRFSSLVYTVTYSALSTATFGFWLNKKFMDLLVVWLLVWLACYCIIYSIVHLWHLLAVESTTIFLDWRTKWKWCLALFVFLHGYLFLLCGSVVRLWH